jgi:hypothetical protein
MWDMSMLGPSFLDKVIKMGKRQKNSNALGNNYKLQKWKKKEIM